MALGERRTRDTLVIAAALEGVEPFMKSDGTQSDGVALVRLSQAHGGEVVARLFLRDREGNTAPLAHEVDGLAPGQEAEFELEVKGSQYGLDFTLRGVQHSKTAV